MSIDPTREKSLAVGNRMMGPAPGEESCGCGPTAVWGLVDAADPRYLGGHVDREGWRHDPLRHADNCPMAEPEQDQIPDAAVEAGVAEVERITAAPDLEAERIGGETPEGFVVRAVLTAALPHLLSAAMVEAAAAALWDRRERVEQRWRQRAHDELVGDGKAVPQATLWYEAVYAGSFPEVRLEVLVEARAALEAALGIAA